MFASQPLTGSLSQSSNPGSQTGVQVPFTQLVVPLGLTHAMPRASAQVRFTAVDRVAIAVLEAHRANQGAGAVDALQLGPRGVAEALAAAAVGVVIEEIGLAAVGTIAVTVAVARVAAGGAGPPRAAGAAVGGARSFQLPRFATRQASRIAAHSVAERRAMR